MIEKRFKVLEHENHKLQPKKCSFMFNELTILGVLINVEGVSSDPKELTGVSKLRSPRTTREGERSHLKNRRVATRLGRRYLSSS
jgi:hypothetical protein